MSDREQLIQQLRDDTMAVQLTVSRFGRRRTLNASQTAEAAAVFETDPAWLRGSKQLLNASHSAYKAVTAVLGRARKFWIDSTIPYPEDGKRLLRRSRLSEWEAGMGSIVDDLAVALTALNAAYRPELLPEAQARLKDLYNEADYPESLEGAFRLDWYYPSVEPPNYLRELHPDVFQAEQRRVAAEFDRAIGMMENAFLTELSGIVSNIVDRLQPQTVADWVYEGPLEITLRESIARVRALAQTVPNPEDPDGQPTLAFTEEQVEELSRLETQLLFATATEIETRDGNLKFRPAGGGRAQKREYPDNTTLQQVLVSQGCRKVGERQERRVFKDAAVTNLTDFFNRFQQLSVRSNADLDALVAQAQEAVSGITPETLREGEGAEALRQTLHDRMAQVASALDGMMEAATGRRINVADEE